MNPDFIDRPHREELDPGEMELGTIAPPTFDLFKEIIGKQKNNKTPGEKGMCIELIIEERAELQKRLHNIV